MYIDCDQSRKIVLRAPSGAVRLHTRPATRHRGAIKFPLAYRSRTEARKCTRPLVRSTGYGTGGHTQMVCCMHACMHVLSCIDCTAEPQRSCCMYTVVCFACMHVAQREMISSVMTLTPLVLRTERVEECVPKPRDRFQHSHPTRRCRRLLALSTCTHDFTKERGRAS